MLNILLLLSIKIEMHNKESLGLKLQRHSQNTLPCLKISSSFLLLTPIHLSRPRQMPFSLESPDCPITSFSVPLTITLYFNQFIHDSTLTPSKLLDGHQGKELNGIKMPDLFLLNPPFLESLPDLSRFKCGYYLSTFHSKLCQSTSHTVFVAYMVVSPFCGRTQRAGLVSSHLCTRVCTAHTATHYLINE